MHDKIQEESCASHAGGKLAKLMFNIRLLLVTSNRQVSHAELVIGTAGLHAELSSIFLLNWVTTLSHRHDIKQIISVFPAADF